MNGYCFFKFYSGLRFFKFQIALGVRFIILFFFIANLTFAQNFEILNTKEEVTTGKVGSLIKSKLLIKNNTESPIHILIDRVESKMEPGQSVYFCKGIDCYEKEPEVLSLSIEIPGNGITRDLENVLSSGLLEGISTVKYAIYEKSEPYEVINYEFIYHVKGGNNVRRPVYSSSEINLNDFYPNPAKNIAFIDYNIKQPESKVNIIIHNILGNIISEHALSPSENKVKIQVQGLSPGVYFYTLYVNNSGKATRKFIVTE